MSDKPASSTLGPGAELGPYRIEALLGTGGMGHVFRALDTRLDRLVAIKTSHEELDPRVEREARAVAQLNHPHICTLHDVGPNYLVMELVEGETLAKRLERGPLPIAAVLKYGREIADALAAAHAKGITHRDLKPQNIMIAKSGVKVLDFGLAKLPEAAPLTVTNAIMGTPAYMAPEQRAGQPADARSDLYAFGLVLRDMAEGLTTSRHPASSPGSLPNQLAWTIERCLATDPDDRWQSARDVAAALELLSVKDDVAEQAGATASPRLRWLVGGGALLILLVAAAAGYWLRAPSPDRVLRFTLAPPAGTTFATMGQGGAPALSPDGRLIAFVAEGTGGRALWVRSLDSFDARPLPGTEGATSPFWSPDGTAVGFVAAGALKTITLTEGQPRTLATGVFATTAGTWGRDGTILFSPTNITLSAVPAGGGEVTRVTEVDVARYEENHLYPLFLPDGRHYLLLMRGGAELDYQLWIGEIGSNARRLLLERASNAQYAPPRAGAPGYLLFARDRSLLAQPFDLGRLELVGDAVTIAEVAPSATGGSGDFSVSAAGVLAYRVDDPPAQEMAWYDRSGKPAGSIGEAPGNPRNNVRISPDGKLVAFTRQGPTAQDVWIHDLERGTTSRLTFGGGRSPVWSPDGAQIAFLRGETVFRKSADGAGAEVPLWTGPGLLALNDWSGDGRYLLVTRWDRNADRGLWLLPNPLDAGATHEPELLEPRGLHGQFAPATGAPRWVSYDDDEAGVREVFVRTMPPAPPGKWQVSRGGGNAARWRDDGRELYFVSGGFVTAVDLAGETSPLIGPPRRLFAGRAITVATFQYAPGYDVSADGERFVSTYTISEAPPTEINVVVNWQAALGIR